MSCVAHDDASGDALLHASDLKTLACAGPSAVATGQPHAAAAIAALMYTSARLKPALTSRAKKAPPADATLTSTPEAQPEAVDVQRAPCFVLDEVALEFDGRQCSDTTPQERADRCVVPEQPLQLYRVRGSAHDGQYVDAVNALTAYLSLRASFNPNSLLHVLIVPCPKLPTAADVALEPGALLRFVACMVHTRLASDRANRFPNQLFLGILGRHVLIEAAFHLFLLQDRTQESYSPCLRRFAAYRDNFPKTAFVDISRCMWTHATLLEDAMYKWLLPEAVAALVTAQAAGRAPHVLDKEAGADADVGGAGAATDVSTASSELDTDVVLALAKFVPPEWVAAADADRLCGDLLYHVAFLADEAAAAASGLHPAWDEHFAMPYTRVAALAAAGVRFTPMLLERLFRRSDLFYVFFGVPAQDFVSSLAKAFTGPWALAQATVVSDLAKLVARRLPRDGVRHLDEDHMLEVETVLVESSAALQLFTCVVTVLDAAAPACAALDTLRAEGAVCAQLCAAIHFVETASRGAPLDSKHAETWLAFVDAVNRLSRTSKP